MLQRTLLLIASALFATGAMATDLPPAGQYLSGGLSAGYTFGAGFTFGYELNAGLFSINNRVEPVHAGITFGRYWVRVRYRRTAYLHRVRFFGVMAESNYFDLKAGWGQARNIWGRGGNNRCKVGGIYYDLGLTTKNPYLPWIGVRQFSYPVSAWAWFWRPYTTVYAKYKYDLAGNSGIKPFSVQ
jgi:hypothetical protein